MKQKTSFILIAIFILLSASLLNAQTKLNGKYFHADTTGIGGEYSFVFKAKNIATFEVLEEDATTTGNGSWSWDSQRGILSVTLTVRLEIAGDEPEDAKVSQKTFQFRKSGNNLKVIKSGSYKHLIGVVFKKN